MDKLKHRIDGIMEINARSLETQIYPFTLRKEVGTSLKKLFLKKKLNVKGIFGFSCFCNKILWQLKGKSFILLHSQVAVLHDGRIKQAGV